MIHPPVPVPQLRGSARPFHHFGLSQAVDHHAQTLLLAMNIPWAAGWMDGFLWGLDDKHVQTCLSKLKHLWPSVTRNLSPCPKSVKDKSPSRMLFSVTGDLPCATSVPKRSSVAWVDRYSSSRAAQFNILTLNISIMELLINHPSWFPQKNIKVKRCLACQSHKSWDADASAPIRP